MRLAELLDVAVIRRLAEANYRASGMPIGIVDAVDGGVLVGYGWQDICTLYHRVNAISAARCRESDDHIKSRLAPGVAVEYRCHNGLRDIGVAILAGGTHLATLFLGQFFYAGEAPDRAYFVAQARELGLDEAGYLAALDRVPVFERAVVDNILAYNKALASFLSDLADAALRRRDAEEQARFLARFPKENPDPVLRIAAGGDVSYANAAALAQLAPLGLAAGAPAPAALAELAGRARATPRRADAEIAVGARTFAASALAIGEEVNVYAHDVTARAAAERALREANRAKDEFLAVLSHELRNPLAPIRNAMQVLERVEPGSEQARRAMEVAGRQLGHLTRLVDDLLDVTRIARGRVELRPARIDVAAVARRTAEDHRALLEERGLALELELPARPAWVEADETRVEQVLGNLLHNAAKFTPRGGRVGVAVRADREAVELVVRDTGAGLDPELLDQVFTPLVQAKQSLARTEGGLGLGLALVKGLVELHRGTVAARSDGAGRGAEFTVRLPALAAPAGEGVADEGPGRSAAAGRRRILVVDDNEDAATSLADLVQLFGHDVAVAYDGASALELVRRHPPDVVLCDIGLPGMSGYDVARALRADHRFDAVRLVAVSGYALPEDRQRALEAGFAEHLAKPADPGRLMSLVAAPAES